MTKRATRKSTRADQYSDLESEFLMRWQQLAPGMPIPEHNIKSLIPGRKHEVDFLWRKERVIVETEGGIFKVGGGRHNRGKGFEDDCWKYNTLTALGYRIFRFTRGMMRRDPIWCVNLVRDAISPLPFVDIQFPDTLSPHWTDDKIKSV